MSYNVICDECGFKFKNHQLRERPFDKLMVCEQCWESVHPQLVITPIPDQKPLPYYRPDIQGNIDVSPATNPTTHTDKPDGTFTTNNSTL